MCTIPHVLDRRSRLNLGAVPSIQTHCFDETWISTTNHCQETSLNFLGLACILAWPASATGHGGVYTYTCPAHCTKGSYPILLILQFLLTFLVIYSISGTTRPFMGVGNSSGMPAAIGSVRRRWNFWPIHDITSGNMTCNFDFAATNYSLHASVQAESTIRTQHNTLNVALNTLHKILVTNSFPCPVTQVMIPNAEGIAFVSSSS
jgi:hypothetical protein